MKPFEAEGIFSCRYDKCPSTSCLRRQMHTRKAKLEFKDYKPDGNCLFFIGPSVQDVLKRENLPHIFSDLTLTV